MAAGTATFDLTTIIVNYNTGHLLAQAIGALRESAQSASLPAPLSLQIILIDNASRDDSVAIIRRDYPECEFIENALNVGFGRANNQALPLIRGRYVLLLNTDAFVSGDTLAKTVAHMESHARCGVLGVRLVGRDGSLQPSCRYFPTPVNSLVSSLRLGNLFPEIRMVDDMNWDHASTRSCDWVPGCYYLIRRETVDQVGLFDPRYFLYFEEVDHCRAVKAAGWGVTYFHDTSVVHLGGESAKSDSELTAKGSQISELQVESELLYFRKHHGLGGMWVVVGSQALQIFGSALKYLLAGGAFESFRSRLEPISVMWSLLKKTAWGLRPTR